MILSDGEFENALLDHQLRFEIARETATLRELIVAKAFAEGDVLEDPPVGDDRDYRAIITSLPLPSPSSDGAVLNVPLGRWRTMSPPAA
jgi:hypothetical protein